MRLTRKHARGLIAAALCMLLPMAAMGETYIPTNRDTRMDGGRMVIAQADLSAYTLLYQTDTCAYWFRDDRDIIAVVDARTGYTWKTGLDAGFPSDIKKAVKNAKTPEELARAAEPQEKSLNARYIGIANSLLTATYYESETIKYISSASESGAESALVPLDAPGAFALDVNFTEIDLQVRVDITFLQSGIRYDIPFEGIRGAGLAKLSSLWLTPFLGASGGEAQYYDFEKGEYGDTVKKPAPDGYFLLPDGSGSLVRFRDNSVAFTEYVGDVYGPDYATNTYYYSGGTDAVAVKHPVMPVFGACHGSKQAAFVAYAEAGGEHMTLCARPEENLRIKYTWAYPSFEYNNTYFKVYNRYGDGYFTLMDKPYAYDVRMTYTFLAGEDADWAGMARAYRSHLIESGTLSAQTLPQALPLRADFILSDVKKGLVGNEQVVVTTLKDVQAMLEDILDAGIPYVTGGLKGWQSGAEVTARPDSFAFYGSIGSKSEYEAMVKALAERGAYLSLSRDVSRINEKMVRFRGSAAQHVNTWFTIQQAGALYQNAPVTVFGAAAPKTAAEWMTTLAQRAAQTGGGLTLTGITSTLVSTHNRYGPVTDITQAIALYQNALESAPEGLRIDMDKPNQYLWPTMNGYLSAPVTGSQYVFETDTVPFLQMVLRGCAEVYGPYCNFSNYTRSDQLRLIDYNVSPAFVLSQLPSYLLADTLSSDLYSTEYSQYQALIRDIYGFVSSALTPVRGYEWVGRDVPSEGVAVNRYEKDGRTARIIVNYTSEAVEIDGVTVKPLDYALSMGGETP